MILLSVELVIWYSRHDRDGLFGKRIHTSLLTNSLKLALGIGAVHQLTPNLWSPEEGIFCLEFTTTMEHLLSHESDYQFEEELNN